MTYIGQIRSYGRGFQSLNITEYNLAKSIFSQAESSLFITTSGIINLIPEKLPFENFTPIINSLISPIPKAFINKDSGDYAFKIIDGVYGFLNISSGAAYLNYAEYYLMFGWFGIFIFSFLLGYLFKRLWVWINIHKNEPIALPIYILNLNFIFMIISRPFLS